MFIVLFAIMQILQILITIKVKLFTRLFNE